MITEYGYWAKKLPKEDLDLTNTVVNTLSKTGVAALYASLPQDKAEIIAKVLFGLTRAKGFIIKGDIDELASDVNWFIRTHEKALLVLIPNEINKGILSRLIDYNKRTKLYTLIINGNNNVISRLKKYGIEIISYGVTKDIEGKQEETKYVEKIQPMQGNAIEEINNANIPPNNNLVPINEVINQAGTNALTSTEIATTPAKVVNEEGVDKNNGGALNNLSEGSATKEEKTLEVPKPSIRRERRSDTMKERPKVRSKVVNTNVMIGIDPIDLISMNTRSKLIDYVDSSIRLRDMMSNLGLKYIVSILVIGPSKSGKTALINYVAKHLGVAIIDYKDPSISIIDNAVIHVPTLKWPSMKI
ncbi:hypothetical protein [Vulcanisaeta distributa]|uniref:hypothetical protein n=1 Tax=Vulcanisaeta distributa TaxID=164451 RepID=UPI0006D1C596|nr:hypothetical protein [Vulcanisaeta distributa]